MVQVMGRPRLVFPPTPLVMTSFYVDDLLTGAETPEQALLCMRN